MTRYVVAMLSIALLAALILAAAVRVFSAQGPVASPPRISELIIRPATGMDGAFLAFSVEAKLVSVDYSHSGAVDARLLGSVSFDLVRTNGNVVLEGESLDDKELMDHLAAIVLREWVKANPPPLPVTRRARRTSP